MCIDSPIFGFEVQTWFWTQVRCVQKINAKGAPQICVNVADSATRHLFLPPFHFLFMFLFGFLSWSHPKIQPFFPPSPPRSGLRCVGLSGTVEFLIRSFWANWESNHFLTGYWPLNWEMISTTMLHLINNINSTTQLRPNSVQTVSHCKPRGER